jgi:vacuolar-type H+-ATPase subunit H
VAERHSHDGETPARRRGATADQVGSILSAAETAAEQIRREAELRVRERIAEAQRAADYRVQAAEDEAADLLADAQKESDRIRREGREAAEQAKTSATSEALTIVANAHQIAEEALEQATEAAATSEREAERYSRELMSEARTTADEFRKEGMQLVGNLRQMGDSLRANAERILRDVQGVHSQMVARIERAEGDSPAGSAPRRQRSNGGRTSARAEFGAAAGDDIPDVPEFIPRR